MRNRMKLSKAVFAYQHFNELIALSLPYPVIRKLRKLRSLLQSEFEFYCEEERKLIASNKVQVDTLGKLLFFDHKSKEKYMQEISCLSETEIDLEISSVTLSASDIGDQRISLECLDALEDFIEIGD